MSFEQQIARAACQAEEECSGDEWADACALPKKGARNDPRSAAEFETRARWP